MSIAEHPAPATAARKQDDDQAKHDERQPRRSLENTLHDRVPKERVNIAFEADLNGLKAAEPEELHPLLSQRDRRPCTGFERPEQFSAQGDQSCKQQQVADDPEDEHADFCPRWCEIAARSQAHDRPVNIATGEQVSVR